MVNKGTNTSELLSHTVQVCDLAEGISWITVRNKYALHQNLRTEPDPSLSIPGRPRLPQISLSYYKFDGEETKALENKSFFSSFSGKYGLKDHRD